MFVDRGGSSNLARHAFNELVSFIAAWALLIDFILVMTNGGPGNRTSVLGFYAYNQAFQRNSVGYGTAVSILITVLSLIAAIAFVKLRERER